MDNFLRCDATGNCMMVQQAVTPIDYRTREQITSDSIADQVA
jgi:hypothetical protein